MFTEGTIGVINDPGILGTIGAWAVAAWYQVLFLFFVIIYSLGQRFGLPERVLRRQLGTRQLLDALADTQYRGQHASEALRTTIRSLEADLRQILRVSRSSDLRPYLGNLPEPLRDALAAGREALKHPLSPEEALGHVQSILAARSSVGKLDAVQLRRL